LFEIYDEVMNADMGSVKSVKPIVEYSDNH